MDMKKWVCTDMCFLGDRRYRPGDEMEASESPGRCWKEVVRMVPASSVKADDDGKAQKSRK